MLGWTDPEATAGGEENKGWLRFILAELRTEASQEANICDGNRLCATYKMENGARRATFNGGNGPEQEDASQYSVEDAQHSENAGWIGLGVGMP